MVLKGGWKLMKPHATGKKVPLALYDLNTDPLEMKNLLAENGKKYQDKVAELEACFKEWSDRTGSGK